MSEINDMNIIRSNENCKCCHRFSCPISSSCIKDDIDKDCYSELWRDVKASRIVIQDMTKRIRLAMILVDYIASNFDL